MNPPSIVIPAQAGIASTNPQLVVIPAKAGIERMNPPLAVIPAKAGIQLPNRPALELDSGLRRNDDGGGHFLRGFVGHRA